MTVASSSIPQQTTISVFGWTSQRELSSWTYSVSTRSVIVDSDNTRAFLVSYGYVLSIIDLRTGELLDTLAGVWYVHMGQSVDTLSMFGVDGAFSLIDLPSMKILCRTPLPGWYQDYKSPIIHVDGGYAVRSYERMYFLDSNGRLDRVIDNVKSIGYSHYLENKDRRLVLRKTRNDEMVRTLDSFPRTQDYMINSALSADGTLLSWMTRHNDSTTCTFHHIPTSTTSSKPITDPNLWVGSSISSPSSIEESSKELRLISFNTATSTFDHIAYPERSSYSNSYYDLIAASPYPLVYRQENGRVRLTSHKNKVVFEVGTLMAPSHFTTSLDGRFLFQTETHYDPTVRTSTKCYDLRRFPRLISADVDIKGANLASLRRYSINAGDVIMSDLFTGDVIDRASIRGIPLDALKDFDPAKVIFDSAGTVWYFAPPRSLWTKGPQDPTFLQRWNGGYFSNIVFLPECDSVYVHMYGNTVGIFERSTGAFRGYMQDKYRDIGGVLDIRKDPASNMLLICTAQQVIVWDPMNAVAQTTIPMPPSSTASTFTKINGGSADGTYLIMSVIGARKLGIIAIDRSTNSTVGTFSNPSIPFLNARFMVTKNEKIRLTTTRGQEHVDLEAGTSRYVVTFNNDSSLVLIGDDSVVILRYPFGGAPSEASELHSFDRPQNPNLLIPRGTTHSWMLYDLTPNVALDVSITDLRGRSRHLRVMPTADHYQLVLEETAVLPSDVYTITGTQNGALVFTQSVLIAP